MPASIGVNLRVTGHCDQGGRKYMEDLFSVAYQQTEDEKDLEYAFFGIFDGHGGSEAAAFAKEHLMDSVVKQRQFWSDNDDDVLRAIRNGYMTTHLNMWRELEKWPKTLSGLPSTAGTTASVAFIRRGKIYIGHVGDSAIVLGYQEEGKEEWKAKPLTLDHKPESVAEMERIQRSGGKVLAKAGVPRVVWNRPKPGHRGPLKKTTPMEEIPFLAVARSLGDLWSYNSDKDEFIVSPDPDVGVLIIDPSKFRCLIFGTDGLWNMISPEMAVHLVQKAERHNDAATVAEATNSGPPGKPRRWLNPSKSLVDCALERWATTRMRADNTSVVSLMLDPPGPPRAEVLRGRGRPPAPAPPGAAPAPSPPARDDDKIRRKLPLSRDSTAKLDAAVPSEDPAESASPGRVPASGLAILDRFPEEDAVASADVPPSAPPALQMATVPLPPCASLDGRFSTSRDSFVSVHCASADSPQDSPRDDPEREADMTNYGNPSDSYFISRLLNKSQLKNSLQNVFEEILCGAREGEAADDRIETVDLSESPVGEESPVVSVQESPDPPTESPAFEPAESIQINEVSSSSPIDVPNESKIRKAKPQVAAVAERPQRNLRSHDAPVVAPRKPQTRLNAAPCIIRNRTARQKSPEPKPNRDRIVILNRPKGILIPNLLQPAKPHPENPIKSKPLHKPTEKRQSPDVGARMTRSRDVEDVNEANFPLGKSRQVKNRPEAEAKPRRSDRPFLAAKNARSDHLESSKENFLEETLAQSGKSSKRRNSGAAIELEPKEKRRTRLNDRKQNETGDVSSTETLLVLHIAATTARRVKPCRKTALSEEVHSTTTDSAFDIPSRALRSKNDLDSTDEQPAQTQSDKPFDKIKRALRSSDALKLADGKRFVMNKVRISHVLKTKDFQPNVEIERLDAESIRQTRSAANAAPAPTKRVMAIGLAKRLNGRTPWPPALVTRNRLRKKFSK